MAFSIGNYSIEKPVILAPMAGVTDLPFRRLCHQHGAGLVVSEMVTSDVRLWDTTKSKMRLVHDAEVSPRSVQIAGSDPKMMAQAAQQNVALGAQIIDINMGCPAKKVLNKAAGSALLRDEPLVKQILESVVSSVDVPVTLKIRTGWSLDERNGIEIARIAEQSGVQALAVHGRTRACKFKGEVEYDTIAKIKQSIGIPVFANGDINDAKQAKFVLDYTGADAVMIGRAAQGRPWIFQEINHYLQHDELLPAPTSEAVRTIVLSHVQALHDFYGSHMGTRIARKHVGWYLQTLDDTTPFRSQFNRIEDAQEQLDLLNEFFASK